VDGEVDGAVVLRAGEGEVKQEQAEASGSG